MSLFYCCKKAFIFVYRQTSLHEKEHSHSHLNMQDISDAGYDHAKRNCKDFKIKKLRRISGFVCSKRCITVSSCI